MPKRPYDEASNSNNQFSLLRSRRFAPFFWTQFLGTFNDNVFKTSLMLSVTFGSVRLAAAGTDVVMNLAAGLFILPFFLFSALAGQLADTVDKTRLIRWTKVVEIGIMGAGAAAFYFQSLPSLLLLLFLMGSQSSFFGPAKYSIIPQHLKPEELVGGNALVETGTFVSILLGTIAGGLIIQLPNARLWVGVTIIGVAAAGYLTGRGIPAAPPPTVGRKINWNPITTTWSTLRFATRKRPVFLAILGISWFWFIGSAYLTQLPNFTRMFLKGSAGLVTLLLAMFSVGIGIGSLLCERLSGRGIELGLVPIGVLGLGLFGLDLSLGYGPASAGPLMNVGDFLAREGSFRLLADLILIGISGGLFTVPLYAFVQNRTAANQRARVIAANNIFNALAMVLSAVSGGLLVGAADLAIPHLFPSLAVACLLIGLYCLRLLPQFVLRFFSWLVTCLMYRIHTKGLEQVPEKGAAVIACNHVSYMDALLIAGACRRPIRFVMYAPFYNIPLIHRICRMARVIPIAPLREDPRTLRRAYSEIKKALAAGEIVCIFPEGKLTRNGELNSFKTGIERILRHSPVPVIPMALQGLWGSFFSHRHGPAMKKAPNRFRSRVGILAGEAMPPREIKAHEIRHEVAQLRGTWL